jgi:hypothetical protein
MSLPASNTTCDIYRNAHSPPAAPDVAGVKCFLRAKGASTLTTPNYSHELWVDPSVDIRDGGGVAGLTISANADKVYIPDKNGTFFYVVLVRRHGRGTAMDHLRLLLQRQSVTYPSNNL